MSPATSQRRWNPLLSRQPFSVVIYQRNFLLTFLQENPRVCETGNGVTWASLSAFLNWVFIGRTDAEAETPVLWPPHAKRKRLIGKDPDAGRDWGQEEKGTTEDEMAGWHLQLYGLEFE